MTMASVLILRGPPTPEQLRDLLSVLGTFIKLAVDIRREVVAAGGAMHFDCEQALLEDGSRQEDVWGADWVSDDKSVRFEALINIRPRQSNAKWRFKTRSAVCRWNKWCAGYLRGRRWTGNSFESVTCATNGRSDWAISHPRWAVFQPLRVIPKR